MVDNYSTHKHPKVKRWLAAHPRYQVHYTPTYASWLNQVEIWFNLITQKAIRRGTFKSVKQLIVKIEQFVTRYNRKSSSICLDRDSGFNTGKDQTTLSMYFRDTTLVSFTDCF